jgi:signal transduction histidine kinase
MSADDLRASRARVAASALRERRAIERALHDGVQQDLVALSVQLQLLCELLRTDAAEALRLAGELQREARDALGRTRALANAIYPPLLAARGLPDALRAAGLRVEGGALGRYADDVEAVVYFSCRALTDDAPGTPTIGLREEGSSLRFELDCGEGIDVTPARDLVEAHGGLLTIEPSAGAGVRVSAAIPF